MESVTDTLALLELRTEKFGLSVAPVEAATAIADATDAASVITQCNLVIAALRANGLIKT